MSIEIQRRFILPPKVTVHRPPEQGDKRESVFTRGPVKAVAHAIGSQDLGADDLGQLSTQVFTNSPGAGLAVTGGLFPLVAAGAAYSVKEARDEFTKKYPAARAAEERQHRQVERQRQLDEARGLTERSERLRYDEARLLRLTNERSIAKLERNLSPLTAVGMNLLAVGVGASAAGSAAAVAGAGVAAAALETTASVALLPAQAALATSAVGHIIGGVRERRQIKQDGAAIESTFHLAKPGEQAALREHQARIQGLNGVGIAANSLKLAGQASMAGGGIAAMTVVGAHVGLGMGVSGATLSIAGAALDGLRGTHEESFVGTRPSAQAVQVNASRNTGSRIEHFGLEGAAALAVDDYAIDRRALAESKLLSLITHTIRHEKPMAGDALTIAEHRRATVEKMVATGHKSFFRRTTLLPSDVKEMQRLFNKDHFQVGFFEGSRQDVLDRVRQRALSHPLVRETAEQQDMRDRIMKNTARRLLKEGDKPTCEWLKPAHGQKSRVINDVDWALQRAGNPGLAQAHASVSAKVLSRQMKTDAKYLRTEARTKIADVGRAMGAMPPPRAQAAAQPSPRVFVRPPSGDHDQPVFSRRSSEFSEG